LLYSRDHHSSHTLPHKLSWDIAWGTFHLHQYLCLSSIMACVHLGIFLFVLLVCLEYNYVDAKKQVGGLSLLITSNHTSTLLSLSLSLSLSIIFSTHHLIDCIYVCMFVNLFVAGSRGCRRPHKKTA
jgi:hypothetical protein